MCNKYDFNGSAEVEMLCKMCQGTRLPLEKCSELLTNAEICLEDVAEARFLPQEWASNPLVQLHKNPSAASALSLTLL